MRKDMIHVLHRHHQRFWAGEQRNGKAGQVGPGLFANSATPNSIRDIAFRVLSQHQGRIRTGGANGRFNAKVGNHWFEVYMKNGVIETVYPLR